VFEPVKFLQNATGAVPAPFDCWLTLRGLKTLELRMQRHADNAAAIAAALKDHPLVSRVYFPGLPEHPGHEIAKRQMTGFGGMVTFDLDGKFDRAERVYDRLKIVKRAASLGGIESLISMPVITSQWGHTDEQLKAAGVTRGMLRLSVGLEDAADLIADLDQALA